MSLDRYLEPPESPYSDEEWQRAEAVLRARRDLPEWTHLDPMDVAAECDDARQPDPDAWRDEQIARQMEGWT